VNSDSKGSATFDGGVPSPEQIANMSLEEYAKHEEVIKKNLEAVAKLRKQN
jgi:hypothetical protein